MCSKCPPSAWKQAVDADATRQQYTYVQWHATQSVDDAVDAPLQFVDVRSWKKYD